jgi:hypothetical protein
VSYHAELVGEEGVDLGQQVEQRSVGHRQGEGSLIRKILEPSLGFLIGERRGKKKDDWGEWALDCWIWGRFSRVPYFVGAGRRRPTAPSSHKAEKEEPARAPV